MANQEFTDGIMLLKADHREVEALFEKYEKTKDSAKKQVIALTICTELKVHTMIEEELFYPAFRGKIEDDTLDEAYVEQDGAKVLIDDIETSGPEAEFYDAKVKVLLGKIKHHVHKEEMPKEGMFAQCRATDVDPVALRDLMLARKRSCSRRPRLPDCHQQKPRRFGSYRPESLHRPNDLQMAIGRMRRSDMCPGAECGWLQSSLKRPAGMARRPHR